MKRQALLMIVALAFASSSFAATQPLQPQPKGGSQSNCLFASKAKRENAKWILPSGQPNNVEKAIKTQARI